MAAALFYLGGGVATVAAGDWLSKKIFARDGVVDIGHLGRGISAFVEGGVANGLSAVAPAGPGERACRILTVFGATGATGLEIVRIALEVGYHVRAFARGGRMRGDEHTCRPTLRQKLAFALGSFVDHERLEIIEGDLLDSDAVHAAIHGAHAVICVAGAHPSSAPGPMATAIKFIVEGCRKQGVRKLIVQCCALCYAPGERWGLLTRGRLARLVEKYQNGNTTLDDNDAVMRYLHGQVQDLDWVVTRHRHSLKGIFLG